MMRTHLVRLALGGLAATTLAIVPTAAQAAAPALTIESGGSVGGDPDCTSASFDGKSKSAPANKAAAFDYKDTVTTAATSDSTDKVKGKATVEAKAKVITKRKSLASAWLTLHATASATTTKGSATQCEGSSVDWAVASSMNFKLRKPGVLMGKLMSSQSGTGICQAVIDGPATWQALVGSGFLLSKPSLSIKLKAPEGAYIAVVFCQMSAGGESKPTAVTDLDFTVSYAKN
ncbi:MAG: hypothetical protein ACSLEW_11420 [Nocardioides sp.]